MRRIVSTSMLRRILGSTLIVMVLRGFCVQKAAEGLQPGKDLCRYHVEKDSE